MLVAVVLGVDALFVAIYFLGDLPRASDVGKLVFTALWTLVTLGVVIRDASAPVPSRLPGESAA